MTTNTTVSTPLDDLKGLVWIMKERLDFALDSLSGRSVELNDGEEWAFDDLQQEAFEALAKHIPGMRYGSDGLPLYENAESFRAARTYDDGTPVVETITFPDVTGLTFHYRPRHDRPRAEFMKWAREEADKHKADIHARYTSVGGVGIEYVGEENGDFAVHLGDDARTVLHRIELLMLREGIDRILGTQERYLDGQVNESDGCDTSHL